MNIIYPVKHVMSLLAREDFEMESKWEGTPPFPFGSQNFTLRNEIGIGNGIQDGVHWFHEME